MNEKVFNHNSFYLSFIYLLIQSMHHTFEHFKSCLPPFSVIDQSYILKKNLNFRSNKYSFLNKLTYFGKYNHCWSVLLIILYIAHWKLKCIKLGIFIHLDPDDILHCMNRGASSYNLLRTSALNGFHSIEEYDSDIGSWEPVAWSSNLSQTIFYNY